VKHDDGGAALSVPMALTIGAGTSMRDIADELVRRLEDDLSQRTHGAQDGRPAISGKLTDEITAVLAEDFVNDDADGGGRDRARLLLNMPNGGSVGYRFGTLPVLVGGELFELSLALFYQRERAADAPKSRRVVMNFKTKTLGEVAIVAQALGTHLQVRIESNSPQAIHQLRGEAPLVESLAERLGWQVTSVGFEERETITGAAARVMTHVLESGAFDHLV